MEDDICCEGTCFEGVFLCDDRCLMYCLDSVFFEGYSRCTYLESVMKCNHFSTIWDKMRLIVSNNTCEGKLCCCACLIYMWYVIPMFLTIVLVFWAIIGFVSIFTPPVLFLLLSLPFLRAKHFRLFAWIEDEEFRADPDMDGHMKEPNAWVSVVG